MIQELRSERVLISLVICVLAAQIPHAQGVWYHASAQTLVFAWPHLWGWLCAWLFAFGLEFSVLMQVIRGRHALSYLFALISVCINLFYFQIVTGLGYWELPLRYWLLSAILPLAIACYSHLCASYVPDAHADRSWPWRAQLHRIRQRLLWWRESRAQLPIADEGDLGARENAVISAVRNGASTVNAIAKATNLNPSTLRRKKRNGAYTGLVENLLRAGLLMDKNGTIVLAP